MAQERKPGLSEQDLSKLVELQIDPGVIAGKIEKDGISFPADEAAVDRLKKAGASDAVLDAVKKAGAAKPGAGAGGPSATGVVITYADITKLLELGIDEGTILKNSNSRPPISSSMLPRSMS